MNYIGKCLTNFKEFYNEINAATLTGAIDVIIVKQKDGTYLTSPFHVRFGKIGVLKSKEKVVDIEINGVPVDIHMKLGETGEAFFVAPLSVGEQLVSFDLATSPLPLEMLQQHSPLSAEVTTDRSCQHDDRQIDGRQLDANEPTGAAGVQLSPTAARAGDDATGQQQEKGSTEVTSAVEISTDEPEPAPECDLVQQEQQQSPAVRSVDSSSSCSPHHVQQRRNNFVPIAPTADGVAPVDSAPERTKRRRQRRRKPARQHQRSFSDTRMLAEVLQQAAAAPNSAGSCPRSASLASPTAILETFHTFQPECHPFSDTDISPPSSRRGSRSPSPIKSDTEFEVERERALTEQTERRPSGAVWQWGELPSPTPASSTFSPSSALPASAAEESHTDSASSAASPSAAVSRAEQERSVLAGVFNFMRKTKKVRHDPLSEGIYLDDLDLDALDPEVAALYFPRSRTAARSQSGGGRGGLRHSTYALDDDEGNGSSAPNSPQPPPADVALSLCGQRCADGLPASEALFLQSLVSYDELATDPELLHRPELLVRIDGRYYSWPVAAPQLACLLAFGRPLPSVATQMLDNRHRPASDANRSESVSPPATSADVATTSVAATPVKKSNSVGYSSWFSWRRQSGPDAEEDVPADPPTDSVEGDLEQQQLASESLPTDAVSADCSKETEGIAHEGVDQVDKRAEEDSVVKDSAAEIDAVFAAETDVDSQITDQATGAENPSIATSEDTGASAQILTELSADQEAAAMERRSECSDLRISESDDVAAELSFDQNEQMYKKSLRLTSEQVERLGLHEGQNEVVFSVTTAYQGTSRCRCNIFLWRYDDKLVISDIDGTITKSDVLGHILPMIGQHWAQSGVAALFSKIRDNGYKFLYLSARAIGQAPITREYLRSVKQGTVCLPEGPLLLSPSSLVSALHREVIEKRPEDFKIPCLRDIQTLFPGGNPLYAGYGNRVNDAFSYRAVGIPYSRIFTINHRGELRHELTHTFQSSYTSLTEMVDHFFPPSGSVGGQVDAQEFNNFCYWRMPLLSVSELPPLE